MNCLNTQQQLDFSLLSWEMSSGSINSWLPENCSPPLLGISNPMSLTSDLMDIYNQPLHSFPDLYCMQPMYPMTPAMWLPPNFLSTQPMQLVRAEIRERSDNWTVEETKAMLTILIANKKKFDNIRRFPSLWSHLAAEMSSKGFVRSVDKCKNRWKVLVAKYKKSFNYMRDNLHHEPHHHPEKFEFFDQMSSLLHAKLTKGPASLIRKFKISP
ncbi:hypothetical protein DSO57_1010995 [Entomophthora muscae]|uniref:Uncharacterized protein n=1 Tax=Entomophthora muscae TaxID=34485 RepID=A0ACC2RL21_9FUNG|nr:hypothetical protein DSO57_1010995 [Entomophthora muscae]